MLPNPKDEPVAYAGIILAVANLLAQFFAKHGIDLDGSTIAAFLTSVVTVVTAFVVRANVHPATKVQAKLEAAHAAGAAGKELPS